MQLNTLACHDFTIPGNQFQLSDIEIEAFVGSFIITLIFHTSV